MTLLLEWLQGVTLEPIYVLLDDQPEVNDTLKCGNFDDGYLDDGELVSKIPWY